MVAALIVLGVFLALTFVCGYSIARMKSLQAEVEVLRAMSRAGAVSGGVAADQVASLDVATPTPEAEAA